MKIKVHCLKPNKFFPIFSWIIRIVQGLNYSHVALDFGQDILDATIDGVHFTSVDKYREKYKIVKTYWFEMPDYTMADAEKFATRHRDASYSISQNIGLGLKHLGIIKKNPFGRNRGKLVCSELVMVFFDEETEWDIADDTDNYDLVITEKYLEAIDASILSRY